MTSELVSADSMRMKSQQGRDLARHTSALTVIINEELKKKRGTGKYKLQVELPGMFDVAGMNDDDAFVYVYMSIIPSLQKKGYVLSWRRNQKRSTILLRIAWRTQREANELTRLRATMRRTQERRRQ